MPNPLVYPLSHLGNTLCIFIILSLTHTLTLACQVHRNHHAAAFKATTYLTSTTSKQEGTTPSSDDTDSNLTAGIIAGISVGGVAILIGIVLLLLFCSRRFGKTQIKEYQGFADWRKDRHLTSIDIERNSSREVAPEDDPAPNVLSRNPREPAALFHV